VIYLSCVFSENTEKRAEGFFGNLGVSWRGCQLRLPW